MRPCLCLLPCALLTLPLAAQRGQGPDRAAVWEHIRKTYDKDGDGKVTAEEHGRGKRSFDNLDRDGDGAITRADFEGRPGGRRPAQPGAGPVSRRAPIAAQLSDTLGSFLHRDGKPGITKAEWQQVVATMKPGDDGVLQDPRALFGKAGNAPMARMGERMIFRLLDTDEDGTLTVKDMDALFGKLDADGDGTVAQGSEIDLPPGPGEVAPDFTLPLAKDGTKTVTLSGFKGRKPVGLIFGSYT